MFVWIGSPYIPVAPLLGAWQRWRADALPWIVVTWAAGHFAFNVLPRRAELGQNLPSFDIYAYASPNFLYAINAVQQGHGLLWNSLQNCGQPFMGVLSTALFYPPNLLFLVLRADFAMLCIIAFHLVLGGLGTYVLLGELGVGRAARLCGALAFELGAITLYLSAWVPQIAGAYVWLPWAFLFCEKILESPRYSMGAALGLILTVELLSGYPQLTLFIYQIIGLRAVWELITRPRSISAHTFGVLIMALSMPLLLGAVQMVPAFEMAGESVRQGPLALNEIRVMTQTWEAFRGQVGMRKSPYGDIVLLVPMALAILGLMRRQTLRLAIFCALVTVLYLTLSFSETAFDLYTRLPLGSLFRAPNRFLWCAAFSFSLLVAFGAAAVFESANERRRLRVGAPIACLMSVGSLYWLAPPAVGAWECLLVLGVLVAASVATLGPPGVQLARIALPVLLTINLFGVGAFPAIGLIKDSSMQYENSDVFEFVRSRMTLQDRTHIMGRHADVSLVYKSASIFNVRSISDYEPQTSLRYAEFYVRLMLNRSMKSINEFYYPLTYVPVNRPLLNLSAARYLIADSAAWDVGELVRKDMEMIWKRGSLRVYENFRALPRAYIVPRIEVVRDPKSILPRLSAPSHDPRRVALLVEPPPEDFPSGQPNATGEVEIVQDRSEVVTLDVRATADTFLVLTDQFYPGWEATVNGEPTTIVLANQAFRLIAVPAGQSKVVFRYRPASLRIGALVSAATLLATVGTVWTRTRRRDRLSS